MLVWLLAAALAGPAATTVAAEGGYVRAMPAGSPATAAFVTLKNTDSVAHALVGASSPAARVVELHTHVAEDGVMRMRPIPEIALAAGQSTTLKPGGLHLMLIGPTEALVEGGVVALELRFEDGTKQSLSVPVQAVAGPGPHGHHGAGACDGQCAGEQAGAGCSCGGRCGGSCKGG